MTELPEMLTIRTETNWLLQVLGGVNEALHEHEQILRQRGMALPSGTLAALKDIQDGLQRLMPQLTNDMVELGQLRSLAKTTALINSSLDIDQVLAEVMDIVVSLTGAQRGYIMLRDEHTGEMVCKATHDLDQTSHEGEFGASQTIVQQVAQSGVPVQITSAIHDEQFKLQDSIRLQGLRSVLCVPLILKDKIIGVVYLDNRYREGIFEGRELSLLTAFANQAAIAIQNASLYRELETYSHSLQETVAARTEELRYAMARLESILDSSSDVIILIRHDATLQQVNPAFQTILGYDPDEMLGRSLALLVTPGEEERLLETLTRVVETSEPERIETTARRYDGSLLDVDIAFSPVLHSDNLVTDVVCSLRDITKRKQMERQLRQTLDREMQISEMKSRFISMASHDLRNPLAVVKVASQMLERYSDQLPEEKQQECFDRIRTSIAAMTKLLDDVLTVAKGEAGKLIFEPERLDLAAFCQELVDESGMVTNTNQEIIFDHEGGCSDVVLDKTLVRHIVSNLLSNAIKYSPDGGAIRFELTCDRQYAVFRIQDQGLGIPEADQERMFETFHRAKNAGQVSGTGLGLTIVKYAVDRHGGTIEFESREGVGTTFTVILPCHR